MADPLTLSTAIVKAQLPIETNGKTSKLLKINLSKCCFAEEKNVRSSDCVTENKKELLWMICCRNKKILREFFVSHISNKLFVLHVDTTKCLWCCTIQSA